MSFKQTKLTVQLILGCVSILTGIVLLFFGIFLPPLGTISTSVIISFCELGTIGAALIGIDYKYHFKVFETEERYRYLENRQRLIMENKKKEEVI